MTENQEEEMSMEEVVEENNVLLNTLIDHLIEKNVISEDEFLKKLNEINSDVEKEHKKEQEGSQEVSDEDSSEPEE
ncbi:MAG: hypothetical protein ACQESF_06385 [Nanobdellota archaeon]